MGKRTKVLAVTGVLVFGGALAVGTPAASADQSTTKCYDGGGNQKKYVLPGKTDLYVGATPCITRYGSGKMTASIRISWGEATLPPFGSGHKFDSFKVNVRLERRPNGSTSDGTVVKKTCDVTGKVNADWSGATTCSVSKADAYNSSYNWSTDGSLTANIDNDGGGASTYNLYGSPIIK